jgi:hypothetical protein
VLLLDLCQARAPALVGWLDRGGGRQVFGFRRPPRQRLRLDPGVPEPTL